MKQKLQKLKGERTISHLFLKAFMLLAFMLSGMGSAWADNIWSEATLQTQTVDDEEDFNPSTSLADVSLSKVSLGGDKVLLDYNGVNTAFYKFTGDESYVKMSFTNGSTFWRYMPGDVLYVTVGSTDTNREVGFRLKSSARPNAKMQTVSNGWTEIEYTLTADDINDDGTISIFRANGTGYACRYLKFRVKCVRWGTDIFVAPNNESWGAASFKVNSATNSNVAIGTDVNVASFSANSNVTFTATPVDGKKFWRWEADGVDANYDNPYTVNIPSSRTYTAVFVEPLTINAVSNNTAYGTVTISYGGTDAESHKVTPWPGSMTFKATATSQGSFEGWYSDEALTNLVSSDANYTKTDIANQNLTLYAKFRNGDNTLHNGRIGERNFTTEFHQARSVEVCIDKGGVVNGHQTGHLSTLTFNVHGNPTGTNWQNFAVIVTKNSKATNEVFNLNTNFECHIAGATKQTPKMYKSVDGVLVEFHKDDNVHANFAKDMQDGQVTVKVAYDGHTVYIYEVMQGNGNTYVMPYTYALEGEKIYVHTTVDHSYILDYSATNPVVAVPTTTYIAYEGCSDEQKTNCLGEAYMFEGFSLDNTKLQAMGLAQNWLVGVGDEIGYRAWPTNRFVKWGGSGVTENPRVVKVADSEPFNHAGDGVVKPTATFGAPETVNFSFSPNPFVTYVGNTSNAKADMFGLPGSGYGHLSHDVRGIGTTDNELVKNNIADINAAFDWVLKGKAGRVYGEIIMAAHDDEDSETHKIVASYAESKAGYELRVKPGRREGSTATYSVDFTQYLNEKEIQDAFGGYAASGSTNGYFTNVNISNDPAVSLTVVAQSLYGNNAKNVPAIRLVNQGGDIRFSVASGSISNVSVYLGDRGDQKIRYYLNGSNNVQVAEANGGVVTLSGVNATSVRFIGTGDGGKVCYVEAIDFDYSTEAGFSSSSVRYNIADLKKSASEVPQLLGMASPTYSSANNKIVRVNADGSLTFLKTGKTSISATANGVTKSYDIEIYADPAEFTVTNNGAQYTYQVTKAGMLPTNAVTSIPGIKFEYGAYGETALVANHQNSSNGNGLGIAVIGSADGNVGSVAPNTTDNLPTSGTYYLFTPSISGTLTISGYFEGSHSAWLKEVNGNNLASTYVLALTRDTKALVTGAVNVEGGKTYCLYCPLDENNRVENYFMLNSFSFVASMKLSAQSYTLPNKKNLPNKNNISLNLDNIVNVEGKGSLTISYELGRVIKYNETDFAAYEPASDETKKTWVKAQPDYDKNTESNLNATISGSTLSIISGADTDGGAILVYVKLSDGSKLPFVVNVPYLGNHIWNFHNMKNKEETRENASWFFDWEVKNGTYIKDPIVLAQEQVSGNNAMLIDQTNGLIINTIGNSRLGLAVTATSTDVESLDRSEVNKQTMLSTKIDVVRNVNLVVLKGATVTIPQVQKDKFIKIYLDPHTANYHKDGGIGNGCEFSVTNVKDLYNKPIDPTHVIMSYGTQWTDNSAYDVKTSYGPYAGCLVFRVQNDGDVTFDFKDNGWDKIVKIEVTDTYSSEMTLGGFYANPEVDASGNITKRVHTERDVEAWNRWENINYVHRHKKDGTLVKAARIGYTGHPLSHAENAKPIDYRIVDIDGVGIHHTINPYTWASGRNGSGNTYTGTDIMVDQGVGNMKLRQDANYQAYSYDGGWHAVNGTTYTLNTNETWLVVGQLVEQTYPRTWDFTDYNVGLGHNGVKTLENLPGQENDGKLMYHKSNFADVKADTTYGYWNTNKTNYFSYFGQDATRQKVYNSGYQTELNDGCPLSPYYCVKHDYEGPGTDGGVDYSYYINTDEKRRYDYNIQMDKPLFANGAQLTYGFTTIPETEGLGIAVNIAPHPSQKTWQNGQIVFDQTDNKAKGIKVENTSMDILVPSVDAGMYIFVKSSAKPTVVGAYYTPSVTLAQVTEGTDDKPFGFEGNTSNDVYVWRVDQTGDVVFRFADGTTVSKIGVTDIAKDILYYGWATESRAVDIDYNETRYFSANVEGSYITNVEGWKQHSDKFDFDKDLEVRIGNVGVTKPITDQASVKQGEGIILRNKEVVYNCEDRDDNKDKKYIVPLFVPACNIENMSYGDAPNKLTGSTYKDALGVHNRTIKTSTENTNENYYTLSIFYVGVKDRDDNTWTSDKVFTNIPRFYRYVGDNGTAAGTEIEVKNKAYLILHRDSDAKLLNSDMIRLDCDNFLDPAATEIESITTTGVNETEDGIYYNVNGQPINGTPAVPGIYIKNGVKYYVK